MTPTKKKRKKSVAASKLSKAQSKKNSRGKGKTKVSLESAETAEADEPVIVNASYASTSVGGGDDLLGEASEEESVNLSDEGKKPELEHTSVKKGSHELGKSELKFKSEKSSSSEFPNFKFKFYVVFHIFPKHVEYEC